MNQDMLNWFRRLFIRSGQTNPLIVLIDGSNNGRNLHKIRTRTDNAKYFPHSILRVRVPDKVIPGQALRQGKRTENVDIFQGNQRNAWNQRRAFNGCGQLREPRYLWTLPRDSLTREWPQYNQRWSVRPGDSRHESPHLRPGVSGRAWNERRRHFPA